MHQWRINVCFDEDLDSKTHKIMNELDGNWGKKVQSLANEQLFPYSQLSLNRKKFVELTFEHQRKAHHRKNIQNCLQSIVRNKIRKERLYFYFYFIKFYRKCMTKSENKTNKEKKNSPNAKSRLVLSDSSHILTE